MAREKPGGGWIPPPPPPPPAEIGLTAYDNTMTMQGEIDIFVAVSCISSVFTCNWEHSPHCEKQEQYLGCNLCPLVRLSSLNHSKTPDLYFYIVANRNQ